MSYVCGRSTSRHVLWLMVTCYLTPHRYEVEAPIGGGVTSSTWRCVHLHTKQVLCAKVIGRANFDIGLGESRILDRLGRLCSTASPFVR